MLNCQCTCFGWNSSPLSPLFVHLKYFYTISCNTFKKIGNIVSQLCFGHWEFLSILLHHLHYFMKKIKERLKKISIFLFQEGRKLELLAKIFTLAITRHTNEFSQANWNAIVYHFHTVNLIVRFPLRYFLLDCITYYLRI